MSEDGAITNRYPDAPKTLAGGILSAAGSVAAGVAAGAAALVAAPVLGAREHGAAGAAAGLACGVAAAVVAPVAGVVRGVGEVARGAANTPAAIQAAAEGKEWDEVTQRYTEYSLPAELERVRAVDVEKTYGAAAAAEASADGGGEAAAVADTSLYVALGVEPSASEAAIKRGYYRKSLRLHPDKNPDDPDAAARFMEVSHAYQTLSNPQRRAAYDRDGLAAVAKADAAGQDGALFEARMLFSTIFGSEDFEALVGQFSMAAEMAVEGREVSADERKFRQLLREVECAAALAARLDGAPADGSSDEAFCSAQAAFAATLCATPFGQRLLHLVGSTYVSLADAYLASFAEGVALTIGHEAQRLGSRLSVVGAFAGAASSTHRAMRAEKEKAEADAEASQSELRRVQTAEHAAAAAAALDSPGALAAAMNTTAESTVAAAAALEAKRAAEAASVRAKRTAALDAVDILWRVCVCDVEATLGAVVHKALHDRSVDKAARMQRARALRVCGQIFRATSAARPIDEVTVRLSADQLPRPLERDAAGAARVPSSAAAADGDDDGGGGGDLPAGLLPGDLLVKIDGEEVVGYHHAIALAPSLAADELAAVSASGAARARVLVLTFVREAAEDLRATSWREQIAAQMGDDGDFNPAAPATPREAAAAEGAAPAAAEGPSWAEMAGRHGGSDEYKFFDFSRAMARAVGETIRGAVDGMTGREALRTRFGAADKVGVLGKRSDHLHQWRRRWFVLDGDTLRWAAAPDDAPHGECTLVHAEHGGAAVAADDFATGQPFSIVLREAGAEPRPGRADSRRVIMLSANSGRERDAWVLALRRAARAGAAGPEPESRE